MRQYGKWLLLAIVISLVAFAFLKGWILMNGDEYAQYRKSFKKHEYLISQYELSEDRYRNMILLIASWKTYEEMKDKNKEHEYVDAIMQTVHALCADLKHSNLSDVEKALIAHDRLILHTKYDEEVVCVDPVTGKHSLSGTTSKQNSYNPYGPLVERIGVCQGYAIAYNLMLNYLDIDSEYIGSVKANHAWNIVSIDGKRYIVDTTHDDPLPDRIGRAYHTNFLVSSVDYFMSDETHRHGDLDLELDDTRFDEAFWKKIDSPFVYDGTHIYYLDNETGSINRYENGVGTPLLELNDVWMTGPGISLAGSSYSLSADGTRLYYSDSKHVYAFDPLTLESKPVWKPTLDSSQYENISDFLAKDGYFEVSIMRVGADQEPKYRTLRTKNPDLEGSEDSEDSAL